MIFPSIQYDFPQAAYLLFAVPMWIWLFWILFRYRMQILERFKISEVLSALLLPRQTAIYWGKACCFSLAWIFSVLALMQPKGNERYPLSDTQGNIAPARQGPLQKVEIKRKAHEVIFLIDASASMSVVDTRVGISRLDYAKEIASAIISQLRGENVSLYAFTSETMQLSPSTNDYLFVRLMLRQLKINEGETSGTDIYQAMAEMRNRYFAIPSPTLKTLVLLSDGGDTHLESLSGSAREKALAAIVNTVDGAAERHLRVFTIGLGSKEGKTIPGITYQGKPVISALEEEVLRQLSEKGRGRYFFANEFTPLDIANRITEAMAQDKPYEEEETLTQQAQARLQKKNFLVYDSYFQIPLGLALLFLALAILLPDTWRKQRVTALNPTCAPTSRFNTAELG
jgi:Ca-activated chloride channel homolog